MNSMHMQGVEHGCWLAQHAWISYYGMSGCADLVMLMCVPEVPSGLVTAAVTVACWHIVQGSHSCTAAY
jgi:hypothetical protein